MITTIGAVPPLDTITRITPNLRESACLFVFEMGTVISTV
jgi:hypothetical protein